MANQCGHRPLDSLRPEVDSIVCELRPTFEPLPIERIAGRLGVELHLHGFRGPVLGAALADRAIILDSRLRGHRRAEVFAHEVAHILHRRGYFGSLAAGEEELFADQFARELLLPVPWLLGSTDSPLDLARRLRVTGRILALQLALVGEAPELMRDRETVLCPVCGSEPLALLCRCRSYRKDRRRRQRLADYRALPAFSPRKNGQLELYEEGEGEHGHELASYLRWQR
jgi:hypothetical protein